jgi:hypothetical protein
MHKTLKRLLLYLLKIRRILTKDQEKESGKIIINIFQKISFEKITVVNNPRDLSEFEHVELEH